MNEKVIVGLYLAAMLVLLAYIWGHERGMAKERRAEEIQRLQEHGRRMEDKLRNYGKGLKHGS